MSSQLEPDVQSLVRSPGVGVRTPPYVPLYPHPQLRQDEYIALKVYEEKYQDVRVSNYTKSCNLIDCKVTSGTEAPTLHFHTTYQDYGTFQVHRDLVRGSRKNRDYFERSPNS